MAADNFVECFTDTEVYEGWHQFSNDKFDPGGATYDGVTQRVYSGYRLMKKLSPRSVRAMTDGECREIFKAQYWDAVRGDDLFKGLDLLIYDIAVNMGQVTAIRFLQQALHVPVDGHFGMGTMLSLRGVNDRAALINKIAAARMSKWHALKTWWRFGKGWGNRGKGIQAKALAMAATA